MPALRSLWLPAVAIAPLLGGCSDAQETPPPDVYVVVIDTMRADRLGCYGYERDTSPYLDRLAREGAMFTDNTAQCSWTKPSMVSLFTSRYITAYQDALPAGASTIAEAFSASGYRTIGVVGNVLLSKKAGFDRGFDHYDARELTKEQRQARKKAGGSGGPCRVLATMREELLEQLAPEVERRAAGERTPQFVYLHPMDTHAPYDRREEYAEALPETGAVPTLPTAWHEERLETLSLGPDDQNVAAEWGVMNRSRGRYDWEVRYTDEQLQLFFEQLERDGLLDNAIIAVVSDHGEELFDHLELLTPKEQQNRPLRRVFQMEHGRNMYEPLIGTPFIFWGSGVPARVIDAPVENIDLYPTLMHLAGLRNPGKLHGRSLVPLLSGDADERASVHSFVMQHTSLRETKTGLQIVLPSELGKRHGGVPLLFDTEADPEQRRNLYDERPDDVTRLAAAIDAWRAAHPTITTILKSKDPDTVRNMQALGYFGEDEEEAAQLERDKRKKDARDD